jgi:ABC-type polysaccharide/polyol phosphate transport system ATPase subunit
MADKNNVVRVDNVSKTFLIPLEASSGIKQKVINQIKGRKGYREFSPLNHISFEIQEGDFFGIVGRNGSGKSTLLKTIAGIYSPSIGTVDVVGSLVPFIELGVGFNPELTGRENVFLNGALLGFSRLEMKAMYDDIVSFAELHNFMEERLKNYSSGMQVRLAFSIAIRAKGDILLLDEVLAVGDEAFQRKCFNYFEQLKRNKKTVILVTHDMASVERFCNRALFLEDGGIKLIGSPHAVASAYSRSNDDAYNEEKKAEEEKKEKQAVKVIESSLKIEVMDIDDKKTKKFIAGDTMQARISWEKEGVRNVGVAIFRQSGEYIFGINTYLDGSTISNKNCKSISFQTTLNMSEGEYFIKADTYGENDGFRIDSNNEGSNFVVSRNKDDIRWGGLTKLKYQWEEK